MGNKGESLMDKQNVIDIIVTSSDKYMPYTAALMVSALENTDKNYHLSFHIITNDVKPQTQKKISMLKSVYNFDIEYKYLNDGICFELPYGPNLHVDSKIVYTKLLVSSLFPELKRAIILDADIIIISNLAELWETNIDNYCIAAVKDLWYKTRPDDKYPYFNSGVLYANLTEWKRINFEKKVIEILPYKKLKFPEQDLFNEIFAGKTLYLNWDWNMETCVEEPWFTALNNNEKQEVTANPKILHYVHKYKPWDNITSPYAEYFWYYARFTPFYETMLLQKSPVAPITKEDIIDAFNWHKYVIKYWRYKILSNITFGKTKERYKRKRVEVKEKILKCKKVRGIK